MSTPEQEPPQAGELDLTPPSIWPIVIAAIAGILCVVFMIVAHVYVGETRADQAYVSHTLTTAAQKEDGGTAHRALLQTMRDLRLQEALWKRRRLGLGIAAIVLFIGAFFGSALRKLHQRVEWLMIDRKPPGS